jgi:tetratricopeptide (TPR) repeat protein
MTQSVPGRLEVLIPRFRALLTRRSSMALCVYGNAGIGKSFEVKELVSKMACQCLTSNANASFAEWLDALPQTDKLPLWAVRALERLEHQETLEASSIAAALATLLSCLAPVVWWLEDAQSASDDRLELLHELGRAVLRTKGVALIVTSRVQLAQPFEGHALEALSMDASKSLLEQSLGAKMPSEASDWIESRACGNPLFALEYLRYLARAGLLWNDGNIWHWRKPLDQTMPVTIEALIERLLDQSSRINCSQTLEAAAVLLPGTAEKVWAEVAGIQTERLREQQTELERHGLFRNAWFAHPLFREVAANGLSMQRRRELARHAVTAFDRHDPQAAAQYLKEAQLEDGVALSLLERAAADALSRGNAVQAARWLAQAVDHAAGETQIRLALEAAQALREVDLPAALGLVERVVLVKPNERAAVYLLSELLAQQGQGSQAIKVLEQITESQPHSSDHVGQQLRVLALAHDFEGVIALYHEHSSKLGVINSELASQLAWSFFLQGETDQAQLIVNQALDLPRLSNLDKANLSSVLAMIENSRGNQTKAAALLNEAISTYRSFGRNTALAEALYNRARALHNASLYREAMTDLEQAAKLEAERGDGHAQAITEIFEAELLTEFGEYQQAEELLNEVRTVLEQYGDTVSLVSCETNLSLLYCAWQPPYGGVLALKHAQSALKLTRQSPTPMLVFQALRASASSEAWSGDRHKAFATATQALEIAQHLGNKAIAWARALLALTLEQIDVPDKAVLEYQHAASLAAEINLNLEVNHYGLEISRLTKDSARASKHLAWFETHNLEHGVALTLRYFPDLAISSVNPARTTLQKIMPRLEVLGSLQLRQETTTKTIRGQKRKELLVLLLEARIAGRNEIPQFELLEFLYPESMPEDAGVALKQLVFQIRSSYGQAAINTTGNGYALGAFDSDSEDFLLTGSTQLWRGAYLEDAGFEPLDLTVRDALYQALRRATENLMQANPKEAARLTRILLNAEPYDLEVLRLCLNALRNDGNHRSLSRVYSAAHTRMLEVGEVLPTGWQAFLKTTSA